MVAGVTYFLHVDMLSFFVFCFFALHDFAYSFLANASARNFFSVGFSYIIKCSIAKGDTPPSIYDLFGISPLNDLEVKPY